MKCFYKRPDRKHFRFCRSHAESIYPMRPFLPLSSIPPSSFSTSSVLLFFQLFKNVKPFLAHGPPQTSFGLHLSHGLQFAILCYRRRGDWRITSHLGICGLLVRSAHCCNRWLQNFIGLIQSEFISESHHSPVWTGGECVCGETSLSCIVVEDYGSFHLNLLPPVGCGHPLHSAGTRERDREERRHTYS